ncbi:SAM-dependent methyltransferase, partial [Halochromatium sp.]
MPISEAMIISLVERGLVPDPIIRAGIRQRLRKTLAELPVNDCERAAEHKKAFIAMMDDSPVAAVPERANEQHYEVPAEFFATVLGPRRKYSCCWWPATVTSLEQAEETSLAETARRAGVDPGMEVLELGCGGGSCRLWAAEQ